MQVAFVAHSVAVIVRHWYEIGEADDEHGTRVEIRQVTRPAHIGTESAAQPITLDRPLWRAVVLSGAMDPVRSPEMRRPEEIAVSLLRDILAEGQKRGEITREFPVSHLAEFMEALYTTVVRRWAIDLTGPHDLSERVASAVDFFLRSAQP